MQPCTLQVGERVVVESAGGPLEAEYALFDAGGIELLSDGPGTIREGGYTTKAKDAIARLAEAGITLALANDLAAAARQIAPLYALGPTARKLVSELGPAELFEARAYEAGARQYVGRWLDLEALARDTNVFRATAIFQAAFLAALLAEVPGDARVFMSTLGFTRDRRPGERTFRKAHLEGAAGLGEALRKLAESPPTREARANGPTRTELLDGVNVRLAAATNDAGRAHLQALARALMVRDAPARGPLADPELWAIEGQLAHGDTKGVLERLDALERSRGRLPGTAYLRARAALLLGSEKPQAIAERVSSLAASMNTFFELELLAADAWKAAGDAKRAKAFARDLVENPNAPDELRIRALEILDTRSSQALRAAPPARAASARPPRGDTLQSSRPPRGDTLQSSRPPRSAKDARGEAKLESKRAPSEAKPESRRPSTHRPRPESRRPDARREADEDAPDTHIDPAPVVHVERAVEAAADDRTLRDRIPAPISKAPAPRVDDIPPPPRTPVMDRAPAPMPPEVTKQATAYDPGRVPPTTPIPEVTAIPVGPPMPRRSEHPPAFPTPAPPAHVPSQMPARPPSTPPLGATLQSQQAPAFMRGASMPPFKAESRPPPPVARRSPPPPRPNAPSEAAEALSLPPGLHGQPPPRDELPRSAIDARVAFTHMSRELGREYRHRSSELRTDVASIERMQRYLHERFADGRIKTHDDADDVRRHGAFLSEILARQLGAYWVDIGPSELGYWAMLVGSKTRVFPFGRVLRFVQMGHKERDLVSYYLELEARSQT